MKKKPRLLDLFCGAGGAAMGYHRAGFEVVGVDIEPQPNYPFEFHQEDAMTYALRGFDAIHASPPCQGYTTMNNRHGQEKTPRLIGPLREALRCAGIPYVIENVEGALVDMQNPLTLHGGHFGLGVNRPRLFECSFLILTPDAPRVKDPVAVYGKHHDGRRLWTRADGTEHHAPDNLAEARAAMGIDWMEWDELREAIPPAYTEWIGKVLRRAI